MAANFTVKSHIKEITEKMEDSVEMILIEWGAFGEGQAMENIREASRIRSSNLINSITNVVRTDEKAVYIGTDVEYAIYNEVGTGIYADSGKGRQTPWAYKDEKGNWHVTKGMTGIHFLRRAVEEHKKEYADIMQDILNK